MFQLVVHVCLQDAPGLCHNEYLTSTATSISQCLGDQVSLAKLIEQHPNFIIQKWHCNSDRKREADL